MDFVLGTLLPLLLVGSGAFFLFDLRLYPFRRPQKLLSALFESGGTEGVSPRQALTTALAGTLGVGNISGVALGIALGGAGALFWMWVCALFAMILKYSEIVLALCLKKKGHGGAMYYIRPRPLALLFALLCLACGFSMGNMTQVRAAAVAAEYAFGAGWSVPILFALLLPTVILRGKRGVFAFAERVIPLLCLLYCLVSLAMILLCRSALPSALRAVFRGAFSRRAAGGGAVGGGMIAALRYGAVRGLISNEAGCGTAPIAHAASDNTPAAQGCLGIAEVFIDTILLCTLTALAILCAPGSGQGGTDAVIVAFSAVLGRWAGWFLTFSILVFAFATVVCWYYYCVECLHFLVGDGYERLFAVIFSIACLGAAVLEERTLFAASDCLIASMTLINLPALWHNRRIIRAQTRQYFE